MSTVTVREILTLPVLRGSYVLAGESGLDRAVSGVNVMEVPDIESFVKPGEILLTTAYPLRDHPEDLGELVRTLSRVGLAAVAVKTGRYLDRLPEEMIAVANELGFPVLHVAEDTSFNEVIGALLAILLTEYGADPAGAEAIRERLTGVALTGGGLDEIARTLAGALARRVDVLDRAGVTLGTGGGGEPVDLPWEFPVTVAGLERGRILVHGEAEPTLGQRRLIRQACFAAGMHIAQAFASLELDRQMRVLFLEELVTGRATDAALARQRSKLFGWDLSEPQLVLLAHCSTELSDGVVNGLARDALPAGSLTWARADEVVALVPQSGLAATGSASHTATAWRDSLVRAGGAEVTVAVGSVAATTTEIGASHSAARESLAIAAATGRGVIEHDQLGLERIILALPKQQLSDLVESELGPLIAVDSATDSGLCATLEMFLGTGNAADASRRLFIHYNTMKHRMARISVLLDTDLHDPRKRLLLGFALQARKLL